MTEITSNIEIPLSTRVLVVDDSKTMLDQMTNILSTLGYKDISSATEGSMAWNLILKQKQLERPFGIILCDWNMPGLLSGIQLLEKVRGNPAITFTVFILVTTENSVEKVKRAIDLGVSNYILKPYSATDVTQKLGSAWKKRKQPPLS